MCVSRDLHFHRRVRRPRSEWVGKWRRRWGGRYDDFTSIFSHRINFVLKYYEMKKKVKNHRKENEEFILILLESAVGRREKNHPICFVVRFIFFILFFFRVVFYYFSLSGGGGGGKVYDLERSSPAPSLSLI